MWSMLSQISKIFPWRFRIFKIQKFLKYRRFFSSKFRVILVLKIIHQVNSSLIMHKKVFENPLSRSCQSKGTIISFFEPSGRIYAEYEPDILRENFSKILKNIILELKCFQNLTAIFQKIWRNNLQLPPFKLKQLIFRSITFIQTQSLFEKLCLATLFWN